VGADRRGAPTVSGDTTKGAKKPINLSDAWREARALVMLHRGRLITGLVLMLVSRAAGLVLPASSKVLIDDVIGKRHVDKLPWLALAVGGATIVQGFTSFALSQLLGVAAQRAIADMRKRVLGHVTRLPIRYFDSTQTGILIARVMNDAEGIRNLVGTGLVQLTGSFVTAGAALAVLIYLNWHLTIITFSILAGVRHRHDVRVPPLRPLFRERGKIYSEVSGRLNETLGGIRVVKAYTAERREQIVFARGIHRLFRNIAQSMTGVSTTMAFSGVIVGAVGIIMMLIGGRDVLNGTMTLGGFIMYLSFTTMLAQPLVELANIGTQLTEAFAGLDRIREVERMTAEDAGDASRDPLPDLHGDVRFEHVGFEYKPGLPVLRDITFDAPAGTTTALVGPSGSGKSTLIGLIMAYHRPVTGRVLVDGHDLASVKLHDFRAHLGVVLQDNFLFDGTVAENIAFSKPQATRAEIEEVSRIAHCDEFIQGFPQGYDTVVGERGVRLSGGQRQRVAIARAILADPTVLILDEATSSLDSESEALIQDGLRKLRQGRTTFVIAHRLSTIRSADQILVLEAGEIVERGTHPALMALNGRYRQLHDKQYAWESNLFINPGEDYVPAEAAPSATPARLTPI
jgi:subfamily B ATP-binding cassette protein MsbA